MNTLQRYIVTEAEANMLDVPFYPDSESDEALDITTLCDDCARSVGEWIGDLSIQERYDERCHSCDAPDEEHGEPTPPYTW